MPECPRCRKELPEAMRFCPSDGAPLDGRGPVGEVIAERYRVLSRIGEGGMSAVFRAEHVLLGRPFAIKFLSRQLLDNPEAVARFEREAQIVSRLRHPHIVEVVDFGRTADGQLYLAMELVEGTDLRALIRSHGRLPLARAREILRQVSLALDFAHGQGVVHRDLKSANIMLAAGPDGGDWVKVVDFGISKVLDAPSGVTALGAALGTPEYMAPEQIEGRPVDARTDLYAVGVVLYEMLAGEVPFQGTVGSVLSAHVATPVPPLRARVSDLPAAVEAVVGRAMAKDPDERFASARSLWEAFDMASTGRATGETLLLAGRTPHGGVAAAEKPAGRSRAVWRAAILASAVALVALGVALALRLGEPPPTAPAVPPAVPRAEPPSRAPADAIAEAVRYVASGRHAEALSALRGVQETEAVCLRAQVRTALGDRERAVTELERCLDLDPRRRLEPAVARVAVEALGSGARKRAYRLLVRELAPAARAPVLEAARHPDPAVRAGAHKVARKLGLADVFDLPAKLLLDLSQAPSCPARRKLVVALARLRDARALPYLERELMRPAPERACFGANVYQAVRAMRRDPAVR